MKYSFEKLDKLASIPGFRVMDWLKRVREESYELQRNDPEAYAMHMRRINKNMENKYGKSTRRSIYSE